MANIEGRSPRNRKTQIGLAIGSSMPVSDACVAVTYAKPRVKRKYARAI